MTERDVDALLRELPQAPAPADFAARVRARVRADTSRRAPSWPRLALGVSAAGLAVLVTGLGVRAHFEHRRATTLQNQLTALRAELTDIRETLDATRTERTRAHRWVYVGGDDQADYLIDLSQLEARRRALVPAAAPVSY